MKKVILVAFIIISLILLKVFVLTPQGGKYELINPMGWASQESSATAQPLPTPNAPKTFKFDRSTNLKEELEKVNPQILDSDFN